jgi:hypothetical protein
MRRDTILTLKLPRGNVFEDYPVREPKLFSKPAKPFSRIAYAAAHVVADPLSAKEPWLDAAIDWDATIAYRRHLASWGFGIAEAMDTAHAAWGWIGRFAGTDTQDARRGAGCRGGIGRRNGSPAG